MAPKRTFDLDELQATIPNIFDQVQTSAATHKKNCVALYKLHSRAATVTETDGNGRHAADVRLVGEKAFAEVVVDMLNRVLVVKKGIPAADRIVKFIGAYAKFLFEKSTSITEDDGDDTPASRFLNRLLKYLLKGTTSKDKNVRYRVVAIISEIVVYLGEIDQDVYSDLRSCLLERLHDKESLVRASCVAGLCKLSASEDPEEVEEDDERIVSHLMESLFYDSAFEVRRAALVHIPFLPSTLPGLLTRMRDVDAVNRKLVYTIVLPRLAHPKQLTIAQREGIVKNGLGDREESVRVAAAKLLGSWVDICEGNLKDFLQLFDVGSSTEVALDALKSVFVTRAEIVNEMEFDEAYWVQLCPETALLARAFVEHCINTASDQTRSRLESALPVVTALAFYVQSQFNSYLTLVREANEAQDLGGESTDEQEAREDNMSEVEFVLGELLQLAVHLDYSDEIGRRKMFGVVREMTAHTLLPDGLVKPCVGVLEVMSVSERDLVRLVVEVINEIRDVFSVQPEDETVIDANVSMATASTHLASQSQQPRLRRPPQEMTAEEKARADVADVRCLNLCVEVLEKVNGSFEENSTLEGILAELIIPAVKRKELALRAQGLISLGLCCLIAKNMAMNSFQLFLNQIKSAPEPLRVKVLQIVFDIMMSYDRDLLGENDIGQRVTTFLMQVLEAEDSKAVQAAICLGFAKLMLFGLVVDERVLLCLVMAYVSPMTADNHELRQCLAYFLPVYCYSSAQNQDRMRCLFTTAYDVIKRMHEDLDEDDNRDAPGTMISPTQFGELFVDWTDPSKSVLVNASSQGLHSVSAPVHLNLAIDIVKALYDSDRPAEDKRIFCQLLNRLVLPEDPDNFILYSAHILNMYLEEQCPLDDSVAEKAFGKYFARVSKVYTKHLDEFDENKCFGEEAYQELYEFIGVAVPRKAKPKRRVAPGKLDLTTGNEDVTDDPREGGSPDEGEEEDKEDVAEVTLKSKPSRTSTRARHQWTPAHDSDALSDSHVPSPSRDDDEGDDSPHNEPKRSKATRGGGLVKLKSQGGAPTKSSSAGDDENGSDISNTSEHTDNADMEKKKPLQPTTPVKTRKSAKRLHTPTKNLAMASPARKRVRPGASGKQQSRPLNGKASSESQPLKTLPNATNQRSTRAKPDTGKVSQRGKKPLQKATSLEESGDDSADEEDSDIAVLAPRKIPRVKERIGWDGSSDI